MILILAAPRTGSSLVTHIFAEHGVWIGECKGEHGFKYKIYENLALRNTVIAITKRAFKERGYKRSFGDPIPINNNDKQQIAAVVRDLKPVDPWCFKVAVDYAELFFQFEPKLIFVRRDPEQAIESLIEKGSRQSQRKLAEEVHTRRVNLMEKYAEEKGGVWVNTDELLEGDYSSIKQAIEYVGLKFDRKIVDRVIDPKKWHHKRSPSTSASRKGSRKSKDSQKKASSPTPPTP